jgi:hypothetical protein
MASVSWTQTTSGSWTTPTAWSTGADPLTGDDVSISTASTVTVTYNTGTLSIDSLITGASDTLLVSGGLLENEGNGYQLSGAVDVTGGTLRLIGGGDYGGSFYNNLTVSGGSLYLVDNAAASGGTLTESGGTITINKGVFNDSENAGSLTGTVTGGGEWYVGGGTTTLNSGFVLSAHTVDFANGEVFLREALTYAGNFSLAGTLDMNGNAVTLNGRSALDGDVNGGTLTFNGPGSLNGLVLDNGALLKLTGSVNQTGGIQLGGSTGTGTLNVGSAATLRITGNDTIIEGPSSGYLINAGEIIKTAGGSNSGTTFISVPITDTGIVDAGVGTIDFDGPGGGANSTLTGTLMGGGTVAFSNGDYVLGSSGTSLALDSHRLIFDGAVSSTNVTLTNVGTYGGNLEQTGGLLLFENNLTLTSTSITALDGGELKGTATITDNGSLTLGSGMALDGNLSFALNGNVDQTSGIYLGNETDSVVQVTLAAGHSWTLEGNSFITGNYGTITNNGTFARLDGSQDVTVQSTLFNNGELDVDSGTLSLIGQGALGGTVAGSAVLDLSGQFTLENGLALSVGELILDAPAQVNDVQASLAGNLTYSKNFAQEGGTLALNGYTLTLGSATGVTSLEAGAIVGNGEVVVTGAASITSVALQQGGILQFNGATEQTGNVTLTGGSSAPELSIGAGATYTMENGLSIGGANGSVVGTLVVGGTLVAAGPGTSTISAAIADNGKIEVSHGQMIFLGPLSGTGAIMVSAGGILSLDNSETISTGVTFGAGGGSLYLQDPTDYAGTVGGFASGDSVELNGFAFTDGTNEASLTVNGKDVTITSPGGGSSLTLTFSTTQTTSSLTLGVGSHGGLALIHL